MKLPLIQKRGVKELIIILLPNELIKFYFRNSTNNNVAFINASGDLCLTQGNCEDNYASCNNAGDGSFIVRNSSNENMSYINKTGSLCLLGSLIQNINVDNGERDYNLTYDNNGNLIQDNNYYYEYNDFNQLIRVKEKSSTGSIKEEYVYDSDGKRILKIVVRGDGNESIYYIGDNFVQIRNSSGVFNTTYYYADNVLLAEKDKSKIKNKGEYIDSVFNVLKLSFNNVDSNGFADVRIGGVC